MDIHKNAPSQDVKINRFRNGTTDDGKWLLTTDN